MSNIYKFRLARSFRYASGVKPDYNGDKQLALPGKASPWLFVDKDGVITIRKGYCWDGCSPKLKILDLFLLGTPDGIINVNTGKPKTYYASMVHDALYQFLDHPDFPYTRQQCDTIFYQLMCKANFKPARVYYYAVRWLGGLRQARKKLMRRWS